MPYKQLQIYRSVFGGVVRLTYKRLIIYISTSSTIFITLNQKQVSFWKLWLEINTLNNQCKLIHIIRYRFLEITHIIKKVINNGEKKHFLNFICAYVNKLKLQTEVALARFNSCLWFSLLVSRVKVWFPLDAISHLLIK